MSPGKATSRYATNKIRKLMLFGLLLQHKKSIESGVSYLWNQLKLTPSLGKNVRKLKIRKSNKLKRTKDASMRQQNLNLVRPELKASE